MDAGRDRLTLGTINNSLGKILVDVGDSLEKRK